MRLSARFLFAFLAAVLYASIVLAQAPDAAAPTVASLTSDYNAAVQARDWPHAVTAAQQLVTLEASSAHLRLLAEAQLSSGALDPALSTCDRALDQANHEKPAAGQPDAGWKDNIAKIHVAKGNTLLKLHRDSDAIAAYTRAAELSPSPAIAWFNVCAVLYNTGKTKEAAGACRKSLQADPTRADAWYLLGSALYVNTSIEFNGKYVIEKETRHALEQYLTLAPDGPHAPDVKAMLTMAAK